MLWIMVQLTTTLGMYYVLHTVVVGWCVQVLKYMCCWIYVDYTGAEYVVVYLFAIVCD